MSFKLSFLFVVGVALLFASASGNQGMLTHFSKLSLLTGLEVFAAYYNALITPHKMHACVGFLVSLIRTCKTLSYHT